MTSKRHFIHQSLIRKRGPFSAALKEREGTRGECIKKKKKWGNKCIKRGDERERGSALDRGEPWVTKAKKKKGYSYTHTELLSTPTDFLFYVLLGVFR